MKARTVPTISVDIDGVIATGDAATVYSDAAGWDYSKCKPIPESIDALRNLAKLGCRIVLNTARWKADKKVTVKWLKDNKVPYDELFMGKPNADIYIDDRSFPHPFNPATDWSLHGISEAIQKIRETCES